MPSATIAASASARSALRHRLVEPQRRLGRLEALQGALEQRDAEVLLQRLDVPAERRLAEAELPGGGRERAFGDDGGEAAPERPVGCSGIRAEALFMHECQSSDIGEYLNDDEWTDLPRHQHRRSETWQGHGSRASTATSATRSPRHSRTPGCDGHRLRPHQQAPDRAGAVRQGRRRQRRGHAGGDRRRRRRRQRAEPAATTSGTRAGWKPRWPASSRRWGRAARR